MDNEACTAAAGAAMSASSSLPSGSLYPSKPCIRGCDPILPVMLLSILPHFLKSCLLFRLDEVIRPHELTETLLEIMPKCYRPVQQGILELLPELVVEQDCEVSLPLLLTCTSRSAANV